MSPRLAAGLAGLLFAAVDAPALPRLERAAAFTLASNETAAVSLFVLADQVDLAGACRDDMFLRAARLRLTGTCANDLWAAADELALDGVVDDHARLAGNKVTVSGRIGNGLLAAGVSLHLATNSPVRGGAVVAADSAILSGTIEGGLRVLANECTLSGRVDGDVYLIAGDIVIMPGTTIGGDLHYRSAAELILDPRVDLQGRLIRDTGPAQGPTDGPPWSDRLVTQTYFLLAAWVAGVFVLGVFPGFMGRAVLGLRGATARCGLTGAIGFALLPLLALAAAFTIVGFPLGLLLGALFVALLYLGKVAVALALGAFLMRWQGPQSLGRAALALLVGLVPVYAAELVPGAGAPLAMLINLLGLGALLQALIRPAAPPLPPPAA